MARHRRGVARRQLVALAVGLFAALTVASAAAEEATATDRLREFFRAANHALADPALEERPYDRLGAIRLLVLDLVDFRAAAAAALGPAWQARSADEREQFVRLFTELLQSSLLSRVRSRARLEGGLAINYTGEVKDYDGVTVRTEMTTRTGDEISVGFAMARSGAGWRVRDVVVEGVSLVANYRAQFQRVLQRESFAELVAEIRDRVDTVAAAIEAPGPPTPAAQTATAAPVKLQAGTPPLASTAAPGPPPPLAVPVAASPAPASLASAPALPSIAAAVRTATAAPVPVVRTTGSAVAMIIPPAALPLAPPVVVAPEPETTTTAPTTPDLELATDEVSFPSSATATSARVVEWKLPRPTTYWVQVGAFHGVEAATRAAVALREHAVTLVTTPGSSPVLRVLLGPFVRRADAVLMLRSLKGRGFDGFLAERPE